MKLNRNFADISSNNAGFFAPAYASAGHPAIAIKATEGDGYVNPHYAAWVQEAHWHNLPVFHYHFCRPENGDPIGQANHFLNTVKPHFRRPGDYVVWDLETDNPRSGAAWLREADRHLISVAGLHAWCYTYLSYLENSDIAVGSRKYWIASLSSHRPGDFRWRINGGELVAWQNSFDTQYAGIGKSDSNLLNPSIARYLAKVRHPR